MEVAAKVAAKPLIVVVSFATAKLASKLLKEEWASKFQPQLETLQRGVDALRAKELKAAQIHFDLARIRLGHDINDESATHELENAKKEAIVALGVVSKATDKAEAIELILITVVMLFLNKQSQTSFRNLFIPTIEECFYFLRKLKALPQIAQFLEMELNNAFGKGTFHSDRMRLLLSAFEMEVQLHRFFASTLSQAKGFEKQDQLVKAVQHVLSYAEDDFLVSMQKLFKKTQDEDLQRLFSNRMDCFVDMFCVSEKAMCWKHVCWIDSVIKLDTKVYAREKIVDLTREKVTRAFKSLDLEILDEAVVIRDLTGVPFDSETDVSIRRKLGALTIDFLKRGRRVDLETAYRIHSLSGVTLLETSDATALFTSQMTKRFIDYDSGGDSAWMTDLPPLSSILGSSYLSSFRQEIGAVEEGYSGVFASSFLSQYTRPENAFSAEEGSKWISAKLKGRPFHEWIVRSFTAPQKILFVEIRATRHVDNAPSKISLDGKLSEEDEWVTIMRNEPGSWRGGEWKTFVVETLRSFRHFRLNFFDNGCSDVVGVFKIKYYV